ncbi:MAG: SDR family oxidoreductase [Chloroflexi bacterium]|nr:SDR family oxidoreductase [Chloroflexota bacterium]
MKSIVITGSSRGIGYGLAHEFLTQGCQVMVNGRSQSTVDAACATLKQTHGDANIAGCVGDVTQIEDLQQVWDTAVSTFGKVDIWINNAGITQPPLPIWEIPADSIDRIVDIDFKGVIYGSKVAISNMLQQGHGHLYNMEGSGSNGRLRAGLNLYGSTKRGLRYLTRALTAETKETAVKVSALSPGMVMTEFILDAYKENPQGLENAKPILNILGDKVETVTPWLVDKILANDKSGASIQWLTTPKILWRFLTARFNKRDLFS